MGGVDLSDMVISLYRTSCKTKRWYLKVLFYCVDIAKVNAWLLYRRHCSQLHIPQKNQYSLLNCISVIANGLINSCRVLPSVGRPSKRASNETNITLSLRKLPKHMPVAENRSLARV
ncbi:piggyBac transposable element-derived protein 2-like [Hydra vulgaris]|uniref:piggyBac transposable element-derived protein 2-like n=1 Tax=Hydra vulgaris TaxID=6087 RepID=UPI001F5F2B3C|nr:piggyBac transposable element-derived protein 2-like [Hydra vulgaris]